MRMSTKLHTYSPRLLVVFGKAHRNYSKNIDCQVSSTVSALTVIGSAPVVMRIVFMRKLTLFLEQKSLLKDYSVTTKNRPNFCCLIVNFIEKTWISAKKIIFFVCSTKFSYFIWVSLKKFFLKILSVRF